MDDWTGTLTGDEREAIAGIAPRIVIVNLINGPDHPLARALSKIAPATLPFRYVTES